MAATAQYAKADEVQRLKAQVDQMKERLDFISPMLPLVNFVQDYFQRVECEASVQLMRLKNAQVMQAPDMEEGDNAQLETVKWLHFMTDAIMTIHQGPALPQPSPAPSPSQPMAGPGGRGGYGRPDMSSPGLANAFPSLGGAAANRAGMPGAPSPSISMASPNMRETGWGAYPETPERQPGMPTPDMRGRDPMARRTSDETIRSRPESLLSAMTPGGGGPNAAPSAMGSLGLAATAAAKASSGNGLTGSGGPLRYLGQSVASEEPLAEPGTGGTDERFNAELMSGGGLIMGRGSWATAYRQASGNRREALRLLCSSGIVTARELSDDLTVISEEHIEECVQIATEMLQTWTLEMWARQPQEAKKFFEARLTALYQRKFGEQKGP